jgi:peptidoglycan/LPS O-acetylase OafA/YrhL
MKNSRLLFFASWIILLIVMGAVMLFSLLSIWRAYIRTPDTLTTGFTTEQIRQYGDQIREGGGEDAVKAFKGRRATAATWALGYALLGIAVVLVPYRRGERWAWWAILVSLGFSQLLSLARAALLGTTLGLGAPGIILAFALIGLLAGAPRMFADGESLEARMNADEANLR